MAIFIHIALYNIIHISLHDTRIMIENRDDINELPIRKSWKTDGNSINETGKRMADKVPTYIMS